MIRAPVVVFSFLLCQGISAQEILWQRIGESNETMLVGPGVFVDDLDGDGWRDLAQYGLQLVGPCEWPRIWFLSGQTGVTLRVFEIPTALYGASQVAPAGDVDGDGKRDYVITLESVQVRSGWDDRLIWEVSGPMWSGFGDHLASDLDVDGDGRPDLVVAAPDEGEGFVYVFDHAGTELYKVPISMWGEMGKVGDVDGDGGDDFVVAGADAETGAESAFVFSGRTGRPLIKGRGRSGERLGSGVSTGCGGDVDGDGVPDFVSSSNGGFATPGVVRVFSGASGAEIYAWTRPPGRQFGRWLAAGDLDQDGVPDLLVGSGEPVQNAGGRIYWYSLRDGTEVTQLHPPGAPAYVTWFGEMEFVGPAQPGSPFPVFTTSESRYRVPGTWVFPGTGRITMWRAAPAGTVGIGSACAGMLPSAPRLGLRVLGGQQQTGVRLPVSAAPAGVPLAWLLGLSSASWAGAPLPLPLEGIGFRGCLLHTSVEVAVPGLTGSTGSAAGYAALDVRLPLAVPPAGTAVYGQALVLGPGATPGGVTGALSWWH